jgi:hypothetical protein
MRGKGEEQSNGVASVALSLSREIPSDCPGSAPTTVSLSGVSLSGFLRKALNVVQHHLIYNLNIRWYGWWYGFSPQSSGLAYNRYGVGSCDRYKCSNNSEVQASSHCFRITIVEHVD